MRPIELIMCAFGPYGGEQRLDFTELGGHASFLIHGPTGAGKSTILDAIAYALYGESSGGGRSGDDMRSKHAAAGAITKVVFTFDLGAKRYRVTRCPAYTRPPARGHGKPVAKPPSAELEHLTASGVAETIAEGVRAVDQQAAELLGLSCDQFRQVAVLAQGRFLEFLEAKAGARKEVLATLFGTERYEKIEQRLASDAKNLASVIRDQVEHRKGLLESLGLHDVSALAGHRAGVATHHTAAVAGVAAAETARDAARGALATGEQDQKHLDDDHLARATLIAVESRSAAVQIQRQRVALGERATALADVMQTAETRRRERDERSAALQQAQTALAAAETAQALTNAALLAEEERAPERASAAQAAAAAARLVGLATEVGTLREQRATIQAALNVLVAAQQEDEQRQAALQADQPTREAAVRAAEIASAEREGLRLSVEQLRTRQKQIAQLKGLIADLAAAELGATEAQTHLEAAEQQVIARHEAARNLEQRWIMGQASRLAASLTAGTPCPVCGSTDHPQVAHSDDGLIDDEMVESARQATEAARQTRDAARDAATQAVFRRDAFDQDVARERTALDSDGAIDQATLSQEIATGQYQWEQAETAASELVARREALQKLQDDLKTRATTLAARLPLIQAQHTALAEVSAVLEDRERQVPEGLRTTERAQQAADAARAEADALDATYTGARTKAEAAHNHAETARAIVTERSSAAEAAERAAATIGNEIITRLSAAGFADESAYMAAQIAPDELTQLRTTLAAYDEELTQARARAAQAALAAQGIAPPDLVALAQALSAADAHLADLQHEAARLEQEIRQIDDVAQQIDTLNVTLKADEARYQIVGHLATMASSKNELGMSFHQYVLARRFDEVLESASQRLWVMSDGRYTIQRAATQGDRRRNSGLDIEIDDYYTASQRRPQTLSGGEGFLASLALALGLADVVQAESGGVYLETLFVDEGFGSLDADTLDDCLETLLDLQAGGRLVGIISHVTALQDRIPAHLEVTRGPAGSAATFRFQGQA